MKSFPYINLNFLKFVHISVGNENTENDLKNQNILKNNTRMARSKLKINKQKTRLVVFKISVFILIVFNQLLAKKVSY